MDKKSKRKILKTILKSDFAESVAVFLATFYIKLIWLTSKITWSGQNIEEMKKLVDKQPVIFAFWHGRLFMMPKISQHAQLSKEMNVIISRHGDGEMIAKVAENFNVKTIRGSSNRPLYDPKGGKDRGGTDAYKDAIATLKNGGVIGITPDGPKGPNMQVKAGAVKIAQATNALIIPVNYSAKRAKIVKSWDKFMLPKLFNHIDINIGAALDVSENIDVEYNISVLENALNISVYEADKKCSRPRIA